jgi:hypothetical protein
MTSATSAGTSPCRAPPTPFVEQFEGLAHARRVSEEDLQLAALCGARFGLDLA